MELSNRTRIYTLLRRELQEYRNSLLVTPLVVGGALVLLMLLSVIFANRLSVFGEGMLGVFSGDEGGGPIRLEINVDAEGDTHILEQDVAPSDGGEAGRAEAPQALLISGTPQPPVAEDAWNFSAEWTFTPPLRERKHSHDGHDHEIESLNPVFMGLHNLFMFVMFLVTLNYLLGCLYSDRKDRSILFWKSMPVSESQEVLCKLAVASLIVPVVFLLASVITQVLTMGLAMLLLWRMDQAPMEMIISNVQFGALLLNQLSAGLVWALWTVPVYAWFMLSSAAARRSPFLLAIAIPIGLVIVEQILFGTNHLLGMIANHLPHLRDGNDAQSMGLYVYGPVWRSLDYVGMVMGFGFAALALAGAVWLRRYRFEV